MKEKKAKKRKVNILKRISIEKPFFFEIILSPEREKGFLIFIYFKRLNLFFFCSKIKNH